MTTKRNRRSFTDEFKKQMVQLYLSGKSKAEIIREYDLTPSSLTRWMKQQQSTGSFKEKDNRTDNENELIHLQKENKRNRTKVEIIKANQDKYSISAMCNVLKIPRSTFYYESKISNENIKDEYTDDIIRIFKSSRKKYGTRRIKKELANENNLC